MKAQVKVNPTTIIEVEAESQKSLFKLVASAHEVFGEKCCGLCGSADIVPVWRTATKQVGKKIDEYEYPEMRCRGRLQDGSYCRAVLSLGTINDDSGTLFPTRKLKEDGTPLTKEDRDNGVEGKHGKHRGWYRWEPKKGDNE